MTFPYRRLRGHVLTLPLRANPQGSVLRAQRDVVPASVGAERGVAVLLCQRGCVTLPDEPSSLHSVPSRDSSAAGHT